MDGSLDLRRTYPDDLLRGRQFAEATGLHGVVESDFFAWPIEVGATPLIRTIARRVARFDWSSPPSDIAATLYQTVIPASERRQLGEYYTPRWLAKAIVKEIVTDPVNQRVLDPSCGSGTFIAECVEHFLGGGEAAEGSGHEDFRDVAERGDGDRRASGCDALGACCVGNCG